MAQIIIPSSDRQIIDQSIVDDLAEEIVEETYPGIDLRPKAFTAYTTATACLIRPHLEALAKAYSCACQTHAGGEAARRFLENMLSAEA